MSVLFFFFRPLARNQIQIAASDAASGDGPAALELVARDPVQRPVGPVDADGVAAEILFVDGLTEENSPPFGGDLARVVFSVFYFRLFFNQLFLFLIIF